MNEHSGLCDVATDNLFSHRIIPDGLFSSLIREAATNRHRSEKISSSICHLDDAGAVSSRGSCLISGPGPTLSEFHLGLGLSFARDFSNSEAELLPTRSSYLYYEKGDHTFFHHDAKFCHITLIIGLSANLPSLVAFPNFGAVSNLDVEKLNSIPSLASLELSQKMLEMFGNRASATPIDLPWQNAVAIQGRKVPHARPLQTESGVVCTACYAFIAAPSDWQTPRA